MPFWSKPTKREPGTDPDTIFAACAWQMRGFGAPRLPRIPPVFQRRDALAETAHDPEGPHSAEEWAENIFYRITADAEIGDFEVQLVARGREEEHGVRRIPLSNCWAEGAPMSYCVDVRGRPTVLWDRASVGEPGRLAADLQVQLAILRLAAVGTPEDYDDRSFLTLLTQAAVGAGMGLDWLGNEVAVEDALRREGGPAVRSFLTVRDMLETGLLVAMRARRLSPEQIIASYGPALPPKFRKRIFSLCADIDGYEPELKLLQTVCDRKSGCGAAQASLRGPRAAIGM